MALNTPISGQSVRGAQGTSAVSSPAAGRFANSKALREIKENWERNGQSPVYVSATFAAPSQKSLKS